MVVVAVIWILYGVVIFPNLPDDAGEPVWHLIHPLSFWIATFSWLIYWFAISGVVINIILTTWLLKRVFEINDIQVLRFYPDRSGGFGPLGRFSLKLTYLALLLGALLVGLAAQEILFGANKQNYFLLIQLIIYAILVPVLFYLPLHSAHRAMLAFRDKLIQETAKKYLAANLSAHGQEAVSVDVLETKLKYMQHLTELEKQERGYPIWPFNLQTRISVVINAVLPLFTTLLSIWIDTALK